MGRVITCWILFVAGLLVQGLPPHLKIANGAFVIPQEMLAEAGKTIAPEEIIRKQRHKQLLSAVLTVSGALGLAFHYRKVLFRGSSRQVAEPAVLPGDRLSNGRRYHTSTPEKSQQEEKEVSS